MAGVAHRHGVAVDIGKEGLGKGVGQDVGCLRPGGTLGEQTVKLPGDGPAGLQIGHIGGVPGAAAIHGGACLGIVVLVETPQTGGHGQGLRHGDLILGGKVAAVVLAVGEAQGVERRHSVVVPGVLRHIGKLPTVAADRGHQRFLRRVGGGHGAHQQEQCQSKCGNAVFHGNLLSALREPECPCRPGSAGGGRG